MALAIRTTARALLRPHAILLLGASAIAAVTFATIIATLDRGFDWSDEGFVYAMVASDRVATGEHWGFQYLLHPLYVLLGESVLAFRVLRVVGYVLLGVALTLCARVVLRSRGIDLGVPGWATVAVTAQIGTFAAWSYPPRYLGYNELSSWFTQLGIALLLVLLLERPRGAATRWRRWWLWGLVGVVIALLVLAKVTAGIFLLLLALVAAALALSPAGWARVSALLGGVGVSFLALFAAGVPLASFFSTMFRLGTDPSAQAASGYGVTALLFTYLSSMFVTVTVLAVPIALAGIVLLVVRGPRPGEVLFPRPAAENVALFLAFVLAIVVVAPSFPGILDSGLFPGALDSWAALGAGNAFLFALAVLAYAALVDRTDVPTNVTEGRASGARRSRAIAGLAFVLFALGPLTSALGTNNRIFGHTVFSATLWAVGAAVGLVLLARRATAGSPVVRALPVALLTALVAASGLGVAGEVFLHPYRSEPYFTQKSPVAEGDLRGLRLTQNEAELYDWIREAGIRQSADGVPAVSLASPGALLAFNASGWTAIWPGPAWAPSIAQSCADDPPRDLFVLQAATTEAGSDAYEQLVEGLATCGIDFPTDFEVVEHHSSGDLTLDVRVWRLTR